jgi:hypothetical protein
MNTIVGLTVNRRRFYNLYGIQQTSLACPVALLVVNDSESPHRWPVTGGRG